MTALTDKLPIARFLHSKNTTARKVPPFGISGHYDGSLGSDEGAIRWFTDPKCGVSYDLLSTDAGELIAVHDFIPDRFAWANGVSLRQPGEIPDARAMRDIRGAPIVPPYVYGQANAGYLAISATTGGVTKEHPDGVQVTTKQALTIALTMAVIYDHGMREPEWGWKLSELDRRIRGHEELAIFNPRDNPGRPELWGKLGRKVDPTGKKSERPIWSINGVRYLVRQLLTVPATLEAIALTAGWPPLTFLPRT